jgi:hypothetical protein
MPRCPVVALLLLPVRMPHQPLLAAQPLRFLQLRRRLPLLLLLQPLRPLLHPLPRLLRPPLHRLLPLLLPPGLT